MNFDTNDSFKLYEPVGKRVRVIDSDTGQAIFTGHRASFGAPWAFWNRIIPDRPYIDLPPKYKIEVIDE